MLCGANRGFRSGGWRFGDVCWRNSSRFFGCFDRWFGGLSDRCGCRRTGCQYDSGHYYYSYQAKYSFFIHVVSSPQIIDNKNSKINLLQTIFKIHLLHRCSLLFKRAYEFFTSFPTDSNSVKQSVKHRPDY